MTVLVKKYRPIKIVSHPGGFFSAILLRDPHPVVVDGMPMHLCERIDTEAYGFDDFEEALSFFSIHFGELEEVKRIYP
jgi:hypothetical protein